MHLRILGTRGNVASSAPGYVKHSGILIDDRLLFDIGEKEYLRYAPKYILPRYHAGVMAVATITKRAAKKSTPVTTDVAGVWPLITQKAYELYEQRGEQHGNDLDDWLEAEEIVMDELYEARE